ncbi:MAG: regulatory protein RecX [Chloroflexota bacterium]
MMAVVTALKQQKRNPQRINVYVDGEYRCALYRITAAWLRIGQEVTETQLAALLEKDGREAAYQQAYRLLERRERTVAEIERRLRERGFSDEIITDLLARLQESGVVNDNRFARNFVEARATFRPRSRRALRVELRQRGLQEAQIAEALADVDEGAMAYQVALKQGRRLQALAWQEFRQKLGAFLARRGFNYEVIAPVVRRVWNEQHSEDESFDDAT